MGAELAGLMAVGPGHLTYRHHRPAIPIHQGHHSADLPQSQQIMTQPGLGPQTGGLQGSLYPGPPFPLAGKAVDTGQPLDSLRSQPQPAFGHHSGCLPGQTQTPVGPGAQPLPKPVTLPGSQLRQGRQGSPDPPDGSIQGIEPPLPGRFPQPVESGPQPGQAGPPGHQLGMDQMEILMQPGAVTPAGGGLIQGGLEFGRHSLPGRQGGQRGQGLGRRQHLTAAGGQYCQGLLGADGLDAPLPGSAAAPLPLLIPPYPKLGRRSPFKAPEATGVEQRVGLIFQPVVQRLVGLGVEGQAIGQLGIA